ncbi:hypothetical protein CDO52_16450 [Nocardiopsis gilva YIM 90087]|uniref:Uncharacterized protein n=1 Tax=Nocardiopsis gilva YIM 90087 TaxID=1235441 RepID=A0A223S7T3_9ACTN|nr:hypothetical protein [Nocardiopsis gilva]ASU84168.1 hypothetical protein CDO52_16450 [Nocardiopsis gilva YIM 90087]
MPTSNTAADHAAVRPPRWALWTAYAVPLCLLPSSLWRLHLAAMPGGWYPVMLSVTEVGLGLLTLGLVYPWGEGVPRWVPLVGGRRIPVMAAVVPAVLGTLAVALITGYGLLNWLFHFVTPEQARAVSPDLMGSSTPFDAEPPGGWLAAAYAPTLAWGPLLAAVTFAYYRRRVYAFSAADNR